LVYSIQDSTEAAIQRMIEGTQRMIRVNNSQREEPEIPINPATKRHFELEIETLQNTPRDEDKLREFLELKEKENEQEAIHIEETLKGWLQRLKC
jgi:hypothetical protein